jgi:hypothetical protein
VHRITLTVVPAFLVITAAASAEPRIDRLAPQDSVFIISVRNLGATIERAKATPLWSLWQSEEMTGVREQFNKDYQEAIKEMFEEVGFEGERFPMPTGPVGLAMFPVMNEELGVNQPGFFMFADHGENIEQAAGLVDAMIRQGRDDGDLLVDEEQILGRTVFTLQPTDQPDAPEPADQPDEADPIDEDFDEDIDFDDEGGPEDMLEAIEKVYYVRDGSVLMVTSHLESLTDALESPDGRKADALADHPDFQAVMTRLGETDAHAVLMLDNIAKVLDAEQNMEFSMIWPMVKSVVGDVKGVGVGLRVDAHDAMLESTWSLHMPGGPAGLMKLMSTPVERGGLPAFVGADAISYSHMHFDFDRLMATLREIVASNAMFAQMGGAEMLAQIEPIVEKLAAGLGSDMHNVTTVAQPVTAESIGSFIAIACDDPAALNTFLGVDMMMQARDFLGHSIYSIDPNILAALPIPGLPDSVGVGAGHVFIGPAAAVEGALRAGAATGAAPAATDPMAKAALAAIPAGPAVGWGFTDIVMQMEATDAMSKHMQEAMIADMRQHNPEEADEFEAAMKEGEGESPWDKVTADVLARYIGPMAWWTGVNDTGFDARMFLLAPVE